MASVGRFYFVVNESDHDLQQDYAGCPFELPAGKAARRPNAPDDDLGEQFEELDAIAFKGSFPPAVKQFIRLDRRHAEVKPDEQKSYVDAFPEAEKPYPNKEGEDFPDGEPAFGWDKKQLRAFFKRHDHDLYKKAKTHLPESVLLEWWMEKHTPEAFEAYKLATSRHGGK